MRKNNIKKQFVAVAMATTMAFSFSTVPMNTWHVKAAAEQQAKQEGKIDVSAEYTFDKESTWDNNSGKENNLALTTNDVPADGTTLNMDVLLPAGEDGSAPSFGGILKAVGVLRLGSNWTWVQSNTIPELKSADFKDTVEIEGKTYYKATVAIPFSETVGANDADGNWNGSTAFADAVTDKISQVTVQFAGYQCDYSGEIAIANAALSNTVAAPKEQTVKEWNFDDNEADSWEANTGWNYQYTGDDQKVSVEDGKLKVDVDYSKAKDVSWSQACISRWGDVDLTDASKVTMDFLYDAKKLDGAFSIKATVQSNDGADTEAETYVSVDTENATDTEDGLKKATVTIPFDSSISGKCCNIVFGIVGQNTSYKGSVYLDNIKFTKEATEDISVDSTVAVSTDKKNVSIADGKLVSSKKDGSEEKTDLATKASLVDAKATAGTKAIYSYLQAMGDSDSVIYGHQNDTWKKAGSNKLSNSDTKDVTGSISGMIGIDALSLTGDEYSASIYNSSVEKEEDKVPETAAGNVEAAAKLTNQNIKDGALITFSAHMPNFSIVKENEDYKEGDPSYSKYDFSGYSPNNLKGDVMNQILPGGQYNEKYNAYLDMIADYASQVDGTILFRPFHENTGSWFWWGAAFCDAATYKNVWKYTVQYLRDKKDIHNLLYVYGPGSEASSVEEYGERYPGDAYVDMVGFDIYNDAPTEDNETTWFKTFENSLNIVQTFAENHKKLVAVTETGIKNEAQKGENQTALLKQGNKDQKWYNTLLEKVSASKASYFLLWANFGKKDGYYTPYVDKVNKDGSLHGHEMLDSFINFYNDSRTVFAAQQKEALADIADTVKVEADTKAEVDGYIVSPVSRDRILDAVTVKATVNNAKDTDVIQVAFNGVNGTKKVTAKKDADGYYVASLTKEEVVALGEKAGTIVLYANDTKLDTINALFNVQKPKEDPYEIDGFENYYGVNDMLNSTWTTNKAAGSKITLSVNSDKEKVYDGDYSMKFDYEETSDGWAGATITKEVDWSKCNALQFYTIPDGNNQKIVVQITANGTVYEAYLNNYKEYCDKKTPMLVTIPFEEFCERDTSGNPKGGLVKDASKIESVGLWVNAIGKSAAVKDGMVSGTIYYDKITAVTSDAKKPVFKDVTATPDKPAKDDTKKDDNSGNNNGGSDNKGNAAATTAAPATTTQAPATTTAAPAATTQATATAEALKATNSSKTTVKNNAIVKVGKNSYKVTDVKKKTVAYNAPSKKTVKNVVIPATIKIGKTTYKVTSVSNNAFKDCKKVTKVTIGKNVTKIGKNAFAGCKNLKNLIIKSKVLKSVDASAFKGVTQKVTVKVPSSKAKVYKKLFKGKGKFQIVIK